MTSRFMLIFAAISGFIFVALGAFGAHVLSKTMGAVEMGWIQTGLEYQAFHTLAILGLALSHLRLWAFVTPVGGVSFLAGWALMLVGAIRLKRKGVSHE